MAALTGAHGLLACPTASRGAGLAGASSTSTPSACKPSPLLVGRASSNGLASTSSSGLVGLDGTSLDSRGSSSSSGRQQQLEPNHTHRPWAMRVDAAQPVLAPRTSEMQGDPFGLLLRQRTIFMGGEVEDFGADAIISQLLLLDSQDPSKDIKLFINSPGGSVTAGMGIYDAMLLCRADVQTYCFGLAASMGAFLLGAGKRGKRYSMPNSRIMVHQPLGGASGQAVDIEIQAKEIMYHKANLNRIMADYTMQPLSKIEEDTDRDRYMSPIEAKEYGIIDHIIGGEDAVFNVRGSTKKFPKIREESVVDRDDLAKRNVLDGDSFMGTSPSFRFSKPETEPYMPNLTEGNPWFKVKKVSKEQYREMLDRSREAAEVIEGGRALPQETEQRKSAKDRIDQSW